MQNISLEVLPLEETVFDNLEFGHPIWPQWDVYSPYDLLPANLPAESISSHLKRPEDHDFEKEKHKEEELNTGATSEPDIELFTNHTELN